MLAGPDSSPRVMRAALYTTIIALDVASEVDIDRTPDDRAFFAAEKVKLEPVLQTLEAKMKALDEFNTHVRPRLGLRVRIGDAVLDSGARTGNAKTKLGLKGKPGLGPEHVFGARINELVDMPTPLQPAKVKKAALRLDEVADFPEKAAIQADLNARADKQQTYLDEREEAELTATKLSSEVVAAVVAGALALAQAKGALDARFPRQQAYVATFFLDVGRKRKPQGSGDEGGGGDGGETPT